MSAGARQLAELREVVGVEPELLLAQLKGAATVQPSLKACTRAAWACAAGCSILQCSWEPRSHQFATSDLIIASGICARWLGLGLCFNLI